MKIKVIKITYNGEVSYLANTGYNDDYNNSTPKTVDNPVSAINYALESNEKRLEDDMYSFYITGVGVGGARSGISADRIDLVEFEVAIKETSTQVLRQGK